MAALNTIDDNQGVNRRQATRRVIRNRRPTILEFTADDFEISMEMPNTSRHCSTDISTIQTYIDTNRPRVLEISFLNGEFAEPPLNLTSQQNSLVNLIITHTVIPKVIPSLICDQLKTLVTINLSFAGLTNASFPEPPEFDLSGSNGSLNYESTSERFLDNYGIFSCTPSLRRLSLGHNSLEQIPSCVLQCFSLHTLSLAYNQITKLPPDLDLLSNLCCLSLNNNYLNELDPSLVRLKKLRSCSIANNSLTQEPIELKQLQNFVAILRMDGNPYLDTNIRFGTFSSPRSKKIFQIPGLVRSSSTSNTRRLTVLHSNKAEMKSHPPLKGTVSARTMRSASGDFQADKRLVPIRRSSSVDTMLDIPESENNSAETVDQWLDMLKMGNHKKLFADNGLTTLDIVIKELSFEKLEQLGISNRVERMIITRNVERLRIAKQETTV